VCGLLQLGKLLRRVKNRLLPQGLTEVNMQRSWKQILFPTTILGRPYTPEEKLATDEDMMGEERCAMIYEMRTGGRCLLIDTMVGGFLTAMLLALVVVLVAVVL
jgi:hypothetical protein